MDKVKKFCIEHKEAVVVGAVAVVVIGVVGKYAYGEHLKAIGEFKEADKHIQLLNKIAHHGEYTLKRNPDGSRWLFTAKMIEEAKPIDVVEAVTEAAA